MIKLEDKLIDKLIFYSSYLHTLAKQGEHIFKTDTLKHIRLAREYMLKALKRLKELKEHDCFKEWQKNIKVINLKNGG